MPRLKRLKATTIIPISLYVERAADRQLRQVIEDMGRPGYVLDARQMGKTNLLMNMKRERECIADAVFYFDLSNRFDSLRGLLRHIVDTLCEARPDLFGNIVDSLTARRRDGMLEDAIEYEQNVRFMIRSVPARMVITLDEVDSLVNTAYSDQFFTLVRSSYANRATYAEYNRLTYVLSGVAEPSELTRIMHRGWRV